MSLRGALTLMESSPTAQQALLAPEIFSDVRTSCCWTNGDELSEERNYSQDCAAPQTLTSQQVSAHARCSNFKSSDWDSE